MNWLTIEQELVPEGERLDRETLENIERAVSERVPKPKGEVNAAFVTDDAIHKLNADYRNKDSVTDVLAFSYLETEENPEVLGDVVISFDQAKRQAEKGVKHEIVMLLVHGILHVLGYDHMEPEDAEVMFPLQDEIVNEVLSV